MHFGRPLFSERESGKLNSNGHHLLEPSMHHLSIHDYLAILYRGRWIIMVSFVAIMLIVLYITYTTPPTYEASTTIMIDEKPGMGQTIFDMSGFSQQRTLINNQVEILKSRSLAQAVIERLVNSAERDSLRLLRKLGEEHTLVDVMDVLRNSLTISPIRETDLIRIDVVAPTSYEATYLAKAVARSYQEMDRDFSRGEISQVVQFLDEQLQRKEKELKQSEETLKNFLEREKIASLNDEATQIVEQGAEFESMYKGILIDLEVARKRLEYLKDQLGQSKATLEAEIARVSSPLVLKLRQEMAEIERTIAVYLSQGVPENDLQVQREKEKLAVIKNKLTHEIRQLVVDGLPPDDPLSQAQDLVLKVLTVETEMTALKARADALQRVVESYSNKLEALPDKNVQLARLERNRKVDENLYMMMREKYEESRITKAGQIGKVRILDEAIRQNTPISPNKKINLILGILMGLGVGVGVTFLREYLDTSVRRIEDLKSLGISILGAIPKFESLVKNGFSDIGSRRNGNEVAPKELTLITHISPKSPVSEAYRTLRTNLHFSESNETLQTYLVTSAGPGDGKSTTIANLAIVTSLQGTRTLLVDSDLRRPVLHKFFGLEKHRGLTNVLIGKSTLDDAIQRTDVKNLDVLTSGILPPNPAELLGSKRMQELVAEMKSRYDLVLFDAPPLIPVTDAAVLSQELDGVLLVAKAAQTHRPALERVVELLHNVRTRVLGILLNNVGREHTYGSYYYYYYYQYYYGEKPKKRKRRSEKLSHEVGL